MGSARRPIAMLHYAGPPGVGGVERTIAAHALFLTARGQPVRILAGAGGEVGEGMDTEIHPELGSRGEEIDAVNGELAAGKTTDRFDDLVDRIADRLTACMAGTSALMAHNVLTLHKNLALTAALARLHQAGDLPPLVAWSHDLAWADPLYAADVHDGWPWDLLRRPWPGVRYVTVSADRRRTLAGLLDIPAEDVAVVPPGVDFEAFLKLDPATASLLDQLHLLQAEPLLVLPARITRRKNIELGIAITAALVRRGLSPVLVVTGPPGPHNPTNADYLADLREAANAHGAGGSVVFLHDYLSPVTDAVMADLYHLADGLLFPSRAEGFGIPLLEAGLSGLPIFCRDLPVLDELAPGADVTFGPDEPPDEIAGRIAASLRADDRYARRRRVRLEYTWRSVCERHLVPLLEAVTGHPA